MIVDWTGKTKRIAISRGGSEEFLAGNLVRSRGLEPPRLAALAPQASASASSATTALASILKATHYTVKCVVRALRESERGRQASQKANPGVRASWVARGQAAKLLEPVAEAVPPGLEA